MARIVGRLGFQAGVIVGMRPGHGAQHQRGIGDRARERPEMHGVVARRHRRLRHAAIGRLQPEHAAEMRRHADRARAVAALVQRTVARRRADTGAGRRGAGIHAVLPGIVRDAGQRAVADAHPAELGRRRLAEDDRARAAQAGDHGVVGRRDLTAAQVGAILDLHAPHGLVVLDRHRHAVQRPDRPTRGQRAVGRLRCVHRFLGRQIGEGIELRLESLDAI